MKIVLAPPATLCKPSQLVSLNEPSPGQRRKPSLSRQQPLLKDDGSPAKIAAISYLSACITKWIRFNIKNMPHSESLPLKANEI
jgi:hypothetical protein